MRIEEYASRGGGAPNRHVIYEPEEAKAEGIEFLNEWRDAERKGQWVLTEDGFVVELLNLGLRNDKLAWVRTCTGSFTVAQRLDTAHRACRWTFSGKHPGIRENRRGLIFADLVASGVDLETAYLQTHEKAKPGWRIKYRAMTLFQSEAVQEAVAEKLDDILKELKIDKRFVLSRFKDLARDADKDAVRLGALKELARMVGIGEKAPKVGGLFGAFAVGEMAKIGEQVTSGELPAGVEVVEESADVSQIEDFVDG